MASDGVQALQKLRPRAGFNFVISDINMPNMNGFDLLREIKGNKQLSNILVLIVSAEERREDIILAQRLGAAGYVVKPFSSETLDLKIKEILLDSLK